MKRGRERGRGPRGARGAQPRPPRAPGARTPSRAPQMALLLAMLAIVVAAIVWFATQARRTTPAPAAPDPIAQLGGSEAYDRGLALARAGEHNRSVPYFRRALDAGLDGQWVVHLNYSVALNNAAFEVRSVRGHAFPVAGSSVNRVALVRASLEQEQIAARLAPDPGIRAGILLERGHTYETWGLVVDALDVYQNVIDLYPKSQQAHGDLVRLIRALSETAPSPRP